MYKYWWRSYEKEVVELQMWATDDPEPLLCDGHGAVIIHWFQVTPIRFFSFTVIIYVCLDLLEFNLQFLSIINFHMADPFENQHYNTKIFERWNFEKKRIECTNNRSLHCRWTMTLKLYDLWDNNFYFKVIF